MRSCRVNEEFLLSTAHHAVLITSLPFVHTARRYYRLSGRTRTQEPAPRWAQPQLCSAKAGERDRVRSLRGSKSRNKVSVGEPAEGSSLMHLRGLAAAQSPGWPGLTTRDSDLASRLTGRRTSLEPPFQA